MNKKPHELTEKEAAGMTVNERLWVSGLMSAYDDAVLKRDNEELTNILKKIHIGTKNIEAIIQFAIDRK